MSDSMRKVSWALRYRPKTFSDFVGQGTTVQILSNIIEQRALHSGYLFTGGHGCGKTSLARVFAKTLNCKSRKGIEPCNECESCHSIDDTVDMDYVEMDGASSGTIESIRALRESAQYATIHGDHKIFSIDECLSYDSRILLSDGTRMKIGSVVNKRIAAQVMAYDFNSHKLVPARISNWQKLKLDKRLLRFDFGPKRGCLDCTGNHKVFTDVRGTWKYAEELKEGDVVVGVSLQDPTQIIRKVIQKITPIVPKMDPYHTYDITVDNAHNFFSNGSLVSNCHGMSNSAFQALLKILEEAPAHVVFMLMTTEFHKVPETIQSRCIVFSLNRIETEFVKGRLEKIAKSENVVVEPAALDIMAKASGGSMRDAVVLLEQMYLFSRNNITVKAVREVLGLVDDIQYLEMVKNILGQNTKSTLESYYKLRSLGVSSRTLVNSLIDVIGQITRAKIGVTVSDPRMEAYVGFKAEQYMKLFNDTVEVQTKMRQSWQSEDAVLEISLAAMSKGFDVASSPTSKQESKVSKDTAVSTSDIKNMFP